MGSRNNKKGGGRKRGVGGGYGRVGPDMETEAERDTL